jgi:hypothetical protein
VVLLSQDLASLRRQLVVDVPKVESPLLPLLVVGRHAAGDVLILPTPPDVKHETTSTNGAPHPLSKLSVKSSPRKRCFHRSQWGSIPKYPSQTATKDGSL